MSEVGLPLIHHCGAACTFCDASPDNRRRSSRYHATRALSGYGRYPGRRRWAPGHHDRFFYQCIAKPPLDLVQCDAGGPGS